MFKKILLVTLLLSSLSGAALMQTAVPSATPMPTILGALTAVTPTPRPAKPQDPRPAICSAPFQAGWVQHTVEAGETLTTLMSGISDLSVTQAAALNCIDDPSHLPVGSFVWLPPVPEAPAQLPTCPQLVPMTEAGCATPSSGIEGAQQLFQNGMMLWRADTQEIWVIFNDESAIQVFDDTYIEGEADPVAAPPTTFFAPKRGFGKVWAALEGDRSPLGWATAPESQVSLTVQPAGRVSYTSYIQLPEGSIYAVTILPGTGKGWWVPLTAS